MENKNQDDKLGEEAKTGAVLDIGKGELSKEEIERVTADLIGAIKTIMIRKSRWIFMNWVLYIRLIWMMSAI